MKNLKLAMKKTVVAGVAALTMVGSFVGGMTTGVTKTYAADNTNYISWMSDIQDDTRLVEVNIPGTHDSGTFGVSTFKSKSDLGRAQDKNIKEQLETGVRAFDLRYKKDSDGEFYIYHGDRDHGVLTECTCYVDYSAFEYEKLSVKAVFDDFKKFLKANPGETIIVSWSFEGNKEEAPTRKDDDGMMKLFKSYDAVALFNRDKASSDEGAYKKNGVETDSLKDVTLDEVRNKIVISNDMFDYNNAVDRSNNWNATVDEKIEDIKYYVEHAPYRGTVDFTPKSLRTSISGRNAWYYNPNKKDFDWYDYAIGTTISIKDQKKAIAKKMKNIKFRTDRIYGVVQFDYVTKEDTKVIIDSNAAITK